MQRHIELEGLTNFRDLGGYATADGRKVVWRRIFRSDTLAQLSARDIETVTGLGVTTACDLRYGEERENEPSRFLGHDRVAVLALGLDARPSYEFMDSFQNAEPTAEQAHRYLLENYKLYPVLYAKAYRRIFDALLADETVVIHCTAGKDRAGTASAMVLTALGVPRETVYEDYLLTNRHWDSSHRVRPGMTPEAARAVFSAREDYLDAAFATIDQQFGGPDAFLADTVGLADEERAALQARFLE